MEWDDLRYFLELARTRTLVKAARRLQVKHTTVSRRIQRLELALGAPLFTRTSSGHVLTKRGEDLLAKGHAIEGLFQGIDQEQHLKPERISGIVRVNCPEGYGMEVITPYISEFQKVYPKLTIELNLQPRPAQLPRNESDITILIDRPERGSYLITKLCDYTLCMYASRAYLDNNPPISRISDLHIHRFVDYIDEKRITNSLPVISDILQGAYICFQSTSIFLQISAISRGAGIGILPSYLIQEREGLRKVLGETISFQRTYWMLMPTELKRIARVQVVWHFLKRIAQEQSVRGRLREGAESYAKVSAIGIRR